MHDVHRGTDPCRAEDGSRGLPSLVETIERSLSKADGKRLRNQPELVMHSQPLRNAHLRRMVTAACVLPILGGSVLVAVGIFRHSTAASGDLGGIWLIAAGAAGVFFGLVVDMLMLLVVKIESNTQRQHNELLDIYERLNRWDKTLDSIAESVGLSDASKSITHREQELAALRGAIRSDIRVHNWDMAAYLVGEMESRFGCEDEASRLRQELDEERASVFRRRLAQAIVRIEELFKAHDWVLAQQEIARLSHVLPDEPRVVGLKEALHRRREEHKQKLLEDWAESLRRDDIDGGIEVLKELDQYLTREESASIESSARDVFKRKLLQLRFRFQYAVTEGRWSDALEVGAQIMSEYPNARMAAEIEESLPALRQRAGLPVEDVIGPSKSAVSQ